MPGWPRAVGAAIAGTANLLLPPLPPGRGECVSILRAPWHWLGGFVEPSGWRDDTFELHLMCEWGCGHFLEQR